MQVGDAIRVLHRHTLRAKIIVLGRSAGRHLVPVAHVVGGCAAHYFLDACAVAVVNVCALTLTRSTHSRLRTGEHSHSANLLE